MKTYFLFIFYLILQGCGPGVTDGTFPISGAQGYFYADSGGNEKYIIGKNKKIVVEARVDDVNVLNNIIYVARRPRVLFLTDRKTLDSKLDSVCEYWQIDLTNDQLSRLGDGRLGDVACK